MRYGSDEGLIDLAKGELVEFRHLLGEILGQIDEDAQYFGCEAEVAHARTIIDRGTSAHQQVAVYESALAAGKSEAAALQEVVGFLISTTSRGL